jgi:hypothetical protein
MKRKKNGKNGHQVFYLSKEHYQQRFHMEPLLIVHQQRFIGRIVADIEISTTVIPLNCCWYTNFNSNSHVEQLLILDTINPWPAFRLESVQKMLFPSHAATAGPRSRKRLEHTLPPLGPHRCCHHHHCPHAETSLTQPQWPLHRCHHRSTTEEQGAPARKHPDLTPRERTPTPTRTSPPPQLAPSDPCLKPPLVNVAQVSPLALLWWIISSLYASNIFAPCPFLWLLISHKTCIYVGIDWNTPSSCSVKQALHLVLAFYYTLCQRWYHVLPRRNTFTSSGQHK